MLGLQPTTIVQSGSRYNLPSFPGDLLQTDSAKAHGVLLSFKRQVDLERTKRITGIITQGAKDFGVVQFVSEFKVAYSNDGKSWTVVKEENTDNEKVSHL